MPAAIELRDIPDAKRAKLPASDFAGKHQSFPIAKPEDVAAAAKSIGRAGSDNYSPDQLKRNIIRIAKRKGQAYVAQLPKAWRDDKKTAARNAIYVPFVAAITLGPAGADGAPRTSWVQVLRTGEFYDPRYGDFSIAAADLAAMAQNFKAGKYPVSPTRLSIDYNHGTSRPATPDQGKAAGWIVDVELRGQGDELWCCVEWTDQGAEMIAAKEYQGLSASFSFAYRNSNGGEEIGPTLFGAALTNVPVVHGMQPATLSLSSAGAFELEDTEDEAAEDAFSFDETRRRVQEALSAAFGVAYGFGASGPCTGCYLVDLFDGRAIYREYTPEGSGDLFQVEYAIGADGVVNFSGTPVEVVADYRPLTGVNDMAKTISVKTADGKDVQLSEETVLDLAKAHAPTGVVDLAEFKALQAKVAEGDAARAAQDAKIVELSTNNLALEKERIEAAATGSVDALIRAGKATAAEKPALVKLAVEKPDLFKALTAARPVIVPIGTAIGSGSDASAITAADEAMALARTEQDTNKTLSSEAALSLVFRKNPELYARYKSETAVKV